MARTSRRRSSSRADRRAPSCAGTSAASRRRRELFVRPLLSGRDYHAAPPRESVVQLRRRDERRGRRDVASVPRRAGDPQPIERHVLARPGLVSQLPVSRGAEPRARRHGRSREPWTLRIRSGRGRGDLDSSRRQRRPRRPRRRPSSRCGCATASPNAAARFRRASTATPITTWSSAATDARSSRAIRGSPTGDATRSSRCAASASRRAG